MGAERQVLGGDRAEPAALPQLRLEASNASGGGLQERGKLLVGQQWMARDQGEGVVELAP